MTANVSALTASLGILMAASCGRLPKLERKSPFAPSILAHVFRTSSEEYDFPALERMTETCCLARCMELPMSRWPDRCLTFGFSHVETWNMSTPFLSSTLLLSSSLSLKLASKKRLTIHSYLAQLLLKVILNSFTACFLCQVIMY